MPPEGSGAVAWDPRPPHSRSHPPLPPARAPRRPAGVSGGGSDSHPCATLAEAFGQRASPHGWPPPRPEPRHPHLQTRPGPWLHVGGLIKRQGSPPGKNAEWSCAAGLAHWSPSPGACEPQHARSLFPPTSWEQSFQFERNGGGGEGGRGGETEKPKGLLSDPLQSKLLGPVTHRPFSPQVWK